jgi:hypothetical protein
MKFKIGKFFTYNNETLEHKKISLWYITLFLLSLIVVSGSISYSIGRIQNIKHLTDYEKELIVVDLNMRDEFSEEKLIQMLKDLNVKYPYIVLAQSRIETGRYSSKIFRENHNLFGMKQANRRVNTAKGTQYNHAFYETWRESVYDYAFYQSRYMNKANNEEEYFYILGQSYAEAPNYVQALKSEVVKHKLKDLFK